DETRATTDRSADGPTQRIAAPPGRTSDRQSSAATGGGASAFASARPYASGSCSSARPQTTWAFGGAHRSRKSNLRRDASSSDTSRSGSACASGIPGEPPPEPTSTMGPSKPRTRSSARSASSTSISRASASFRSAVSPGVGGRGERRPRRASPPGGAGGGGWGGPGGSPQLVTSARDDDDVAV